MKQNECHNVHRLPASFQSHIRTTSFFVSMASVCRKAKWKGSRSNKKCARGISLARAARWSWRALPASGRSPQHVMLWVSKEEWAFICPLCIYSLGQDITNWWQTVFTLYICSCTWIYLLMVSWKQSAICAVNCIIYYTCGTEIFKQSLIFFLV